ncbi:pro-sigmaK processing inhibitor BofA family protein [Haloimpatiens massiliensis]|uniref:pro-sigmaK processing inhibitor BofA family protein n=1 Tax=Haloimpatiens massiliensis TaxID=1658110 RepID=UPI000C827D96|nr:pro-sigmaK processing inhibitor BofA family protein [Haloimpatiens massiliensis]
MQLEYIGYFLIGIVLMVILVKLLAWPLKILLKLIVNGVLGAVLLILVNLVGGAFGLSIGVNAITALIAGFFGVPGVIFLIIFQNLL